jgi:hypothetical protein
MPLLLPGIVISLVDAGPAERAEGAVDEPPYRLSAEACPLPCRLAESYEEVVVIETRMPHEDSLVTAQEMPRHIVVDDRETRGAPPEEPTMDPEPSWPCLPYKKQDEGELWRRAKALPIPNGLKAQEREDPADLSLCKPIEILVELSVGSG